jgi:glycosyltransferase involved in cell wall biosynthesis
MALGVPVVASRIAGVTEQIDEGVTGLLVAPGDPGALADALKRAAGDLALRASAASSGPRVVAERFSVDTAARGLAAVLQELAA